MFGSTGDHLRAPRLEDDAFARVVENDVEAREETGTEATVCQHGFSEASYYLWRSKFGSMSVPDAKRLRELETENARLKKLLAKSPATESKRTSAPYYLTV